MAHPFQDKARQSHGDRLRDMTGKRGEYPVDRASRIADVPQTSANAQGDASRAPEEVFNGAPARQVSNYGTVKGK